MKTLPYWKLIQFLLCCICCTQLNAQTHTVSGTLADSHTGESLQSAAITTEDGTSGAVSNSYGYFSITLAAKKNVIIITYIGLAPQRIAIDLSSTDINLGRIKMAPASTDLSAVVIKADRPSMRRHIQSTQMGIIDLPIKLLMKVPSIAGEPDIIKALQLTPGVKRGGEGSIGMYVRGGGVDENLVILDEATVYNAGHLLGFFSVFNTSALKDVQLYKSTFPAQYGGRLSSILDVRLKDGNMEKFQADGSIGFISSNLTLQGPIQKSKSSFIVSARRTYLDVVTGNTVPYHFYDVNAKFNKIIDSGNRIFLSLYKGDDVLSLKPSPTDNTSQTLRAGLKLGNTIGSFRWNHIFKDPRFFSNVSIIYTKFRYNIEGQYGNNSLIIASAIRDIGAKADISFKPNQQHSMLMGAQIINHLFTPNIISSSGINNQNLKDRPVKKIYNTEFGVYVNDEFKASEKVSFNTGLRITGDATPGKTYFHLEPRLGTRYLINDKSSIKASYTRMVQNMHLVASSSMALPTDLWYPVTKNILPGKSDQVSLGYYRNLLKSSIAFSVEGYYKWLNNLIEYKEGASLILNDNYEKELVRGKGKSYGIEFFATKTTGRLQGWIGYTLSYAYRVFDSLNNGKQYFARFDRRHDFSLVASYDMSKRWSVSATYVYSSGSPFTAQASQFIAPSPNFTSIDVLPVYSAHNAVRLSGAQRIDLDFTHKFTVAHTIKADLHLGCYNFLNAVQPGRITREFNNTTGQFEYRQAGFFGFIPGIAVNFHY